MNGSHALNVCRTASLMQYPTSWALPSSGQSWSPPSLAALHISIAARCQLNCSSGAFVGDSALLPGMPSSTYSIELRVSRNVLRPSARRPRPGGNGYSDCPIRNVGLSSQEPWSYSRNQSTAGCRSRLRISQCWKKQFVVSRCVQAYSPLRDGGNILELVRSPGERGI